jgi:hypothetical protein
VTGFAGSACVIGGFYITLSRLSLEALPIVQWGKPPELRVKLERTVALFSRTLAAIRRRNKSSGASPLISAKGKMIKTFLITHFAQPFILRYKS